MRRNDAARAHGGRGRAIAAFILSLGLVIGAVAIVGFAQGWLNVDSSDQTTTIEVDRARLRGAADDTAEATEKAMQETGETLEKIGEQMQAQATPQGEE